MKYPTSIPIIISLILSMIFMEFNVDTQVSPVQVSAQIIKKAVKKSLKKTAKKEMKKSSASVAKKGVKSTAKKAVRTESKNAVRLSTKNISKRVLSGMTAEQQELFIKKGYKQIDVDFAGKKTPLLVSKEFDPNLKVSRELTGDFNPVKYHKNNPKYVKDGCETNLGRMKRGLAPVYKDPANADPKWHGYSSFDIHHGGQKASPDYIALMGKEHETCSKILHTNAKGIKSEINRAEFGSKERAPMYKHWAEVFENTLETKVLLK